MWTNIAHPVCHLGFFPHQHCRFSIQNNWLFIILICTHFKWLTRCWRTNMAQCGGKQETSKVLFFKNVNGKDKLIKIRLHKIQDARSCLGHVSTLFVLSRDDNFLSVQICIITYHRMTDRYEDLKKKNNTSRY